MNKSIVKPVVWLVFSICTFLFFFSFRGNLSWRKMDTAEDYIVIEDDIPFEWTFGNIFRALFAYGPLALSVIVAIWALNKIRRLI